MYIYKKSKNMILINHPNILILKKHKLLIYHALKQFNRRKDTRI